MPDGRVASGELDARARALLDVARRSIEEGVRSGRPLEVDLESHPPELREPRATFVTLRRGGDLRGCIGGLEPRTALVRDVAESAFKAAFRDPRFAPVADWELDDLDIHVSVLSPVERLAVRSERELLDTLRPKRDGILLAGAGHHGTFLPSMWESLPDPRDFLRELKRKAGLPSDAWPEGLEVFRYTAESIP